MIELEPGKLYTTRQVFCDWMGYRRLRWYYDNKELLRQRGFPNPIPKPGRPRWRGEDLLAWAAADKRLAHELQKPGTNVHSLAELARARSASLIHGRRRAS